MDFLNNNSPVFLGNDDFSPAPGAKAPLSRLYKDGQPLTPAVPKPSFRRTFYGSREKMAELEGWQIEAVLTMQELLDSAIAFQSKHLRLGHFVAEQDLAIRFKNKCQYDWAAQIAIHHLRPAIESIGMALDGEYIEPDTDEQAHSANYQVNAVQTEGDMWRSELFIEFNPAPDASPAPRAKGATRDTLCIPAEVRIESAFALFYNKSLGKLERIGFSATVRANGVVFNVEAFDDATGQQIDLPFRFVQPVFRVARIAAKPTFAAFFSKFRYPFLIEEGLAQPVQSAQPIELSGFIALRSNQLQAAAACVPSKNQIPELA